MNGHNGHIHTLLGNGYLFTTRSSQKQVPSELEQLVLLGRLGQYQDADACFQANLRDHLDQFTVVAEYADLLLDQGKYGQLGRFARDRLAIGCFEHDENHLLDLSIKLSDLYLHGSLREAVATAKLYWKTLASKISGQPEGLSSTLVSMQYSTQRAELKDRRSGRSSDI